MSIYEPTSTQAVDDVFKNFCLQGKFVLQGNLWAGQQML